MTTSLRCCTFLFYLLIWRQFHQWNFSGATATDEADFDDPFIFHVGCFWLLLLLLLAPRERQLKVTKCIASNHTRPGGPQTPPPHQQPIQPIQQEGLSSLNKKQLAPRESFVTLKTKNHRWYTHTLASFSLESCKRAAARNTSIYL